jgi:hypothetical protein
MRYKKCHNLHTETKSLLLLQMSGARLGQGSMPPLLRLSSSQIHEYNYGLFPMGTEEESRFSYKLTFNFSLITLMHSE